MELERAKESLQAADLCLEHNLVNSAVSRAYYAMFQAAQVALEAEGFARLEWSHRGMQSSFNHQVIHKKKLYPRVFVSYLTFALTVRQAADYGEPGTSVRIARRQVRRARVFIETVEEVVSHGKRSKS